MIQLCDLLAALDEAQVYGPTDGVIAALAYDSRKVLPGTLFVAIKGSHSDGHHYIKQALERGATAVLVDGRYWNPQSAEQPQPSTLVIVPNSLTALAPLAARFYGYPGYELGLVGITGTKGKTTTTALTSRLLEAGGHTVGMMSTVDFKIGPRQWPNKTRQSTLEAPEVQGMLREMVGAGCDYGVIEASSHALSPRWNRLGGCTFAVAVCTNVTHEHLDFHGSVEQYRQDKARLFEMLGANAEQLSGTPRHSAWAIVNADDPHHQLYLAAAPATAERLTYGVREAADVRAVDPICTPEGSRFLVETPWGNSEVRLTLPGVFNVHNTLAALSVGLSQGVPLEQCAAALEAFSNVRGRMERISAGQPFSVIVDYAHNPDSFEQVLGMFRPLTSGRMIAVFGSAGERDRAKRPLQGAIAAHYCQLLVLTDEDPRGEDSLAILSEIAAGVEAEGLREGTGYVCIPDRAAALRFALGQARPGDLVLLLGKGHEGSIEYADRSLPWDEAAEARAALGELLSAEC